MKFKKVAVLTSKKSWFVSYARNLVEKLREKNLNAKLFFRHEDIPSDYEIVFILSYFRMVPEEFLRQHRHNLVVHESDLPQGKGWAPLFWQILEGKNCIPIVLFEAVPEMDAGDIYIKDFISLEGHELHDEIRQKQAEKTIELCLRFLEEYEYLSPQPQKGQETFYPKRTPKDSKLDIDKTIKEQFNLLRIVNNEEFPAYFCYRGYKYILKIYKVEIIDNDC